MRNVNNMAMANQLSGLSENADNNQINVSNNNKKNKTEIEWFCIKSPVKDSATKHPKNKYFESIKFLENLLKNIFNMKLFGSLYL